MLLQSILRKRFCLTWRLAILQNFLSGLNQVLLSYLILIDTQWLVGNTHIVYFVAPYLSCPDSDTVHPLSVTQAAFSTALGESLRVKLSPTTLAVCIETNGFLMTLGDCCYLWPHLGSREALVRLCLVSPAPVSVSLRSARCLGDIWPWITMVR